MSSRIYQIAVVLFWLATTNWLVITKIMPALRQGDPPNHHAAVLASLNDGTPVIWKMRWNSHQVGWAATKVVKRANGQNEIRNRIRFTGWPEGETKLPYLLQGLLKSSDLVGAAGLEITNRTVLNDQNRLLHVDSLITTADRLDASPVITIRGDVRDNELILSYQAGALSGTRTIPLRPHAMIANEVSPLGYMPPLRLHQEWTTYRISAWQIKTKQTPIVAKVERYDPITWNGRDVEAMLVVYRKDRGTGSRSAEDYVGRLWVHPKDGMVLRQEVVILNSHLKFIRGTPGEAKPLTDELDKDWMAPYAKALGASVGQPMEGVAPR